MTIKILFKQATRLFVLFIIIGLLPTRAMAWGAKGHQVIAHIAMGRLSATARKSIEELLGRDTLATVSTWADQQRDETESWHSVAIPLKDSYYAPGKDCQKGSTCIIEAIGEQIVILRDTNRNREERAKALKFVVHLIGDLHQPFHVTTNTDPQDSSATKVTVKTLSGRRTNLHEVWDTELVEYGSRQPKFVDDYAAQLSSRFRGGLATQSVSQGISTQGSITDWALEAHKLPWDAYYHTKGEFMVADNEREWQLDQDYYDKNLQLVEVQLMRAGTRLARVLNEAFGAAAR